MTEDYIQMPTDGSGKKVRSIKTTVGANDVYQQVFNVADTADTGGTIIWNMTEKIGGVSSKQLSFAYDTNVQRGAGSDGDEAPVTCVAIGLATGQFVKATGTITRSIANSVSLVAPLERNYANP